MGKFVISKRINGEFQFNLKAGNGQIVLQSEGYTTKTACENGINSVKENSKDPNRFDLKTATNGKYYFALKAGNGQIIGSSQMYETEASRQTGIDSVTSNAGDAEIVEELG